MQAILPKPEVREQETRSSTCMRILRPTNLLIVALVALGIIFISSGLGAAMAPAEGPDTITVDGVEYQATQKSGPVSHFETPDVNPAEAFTDRNVWDGNGSENLPCEEGIHWIDNANVLTVSHCLGETEETTTTTEQATTTTTDGTTTTTEEEVTTTSTIDTTTSTENVVTTITSPAPSTTVPTITVTTDTPSPELPFTGMEDWLLPLGILLLATGGLLVRKTSASIHS
jgi:hypothetical protein